MNLTREFLKAKHWQLFLLMFAVPLLFQVFLMASLVTNLAKGDPPDPTVFSPIMMIFPLLIMLCVGTMFGWLWSVAIGLQPKVPSHIKMKVPKFKVLFFIPVTYIVIIMTGVMILLSQPYTPSENNQPNVGLIGLSMLVIIPLHLFSIFCIFYCLYFAAKTMMTAELQRETSFSDFAGEFFLFWFHPIGVWVIQPRINKLAENLDETQK
ncbi:MAG: hypothetical protein JNK10_04880 [Cyclobacteriaceae bacterium]|nr:hypothetical protein [Cyclobacteriaceae bacterium]